LEFLAGIFEGPVQRRGGRVNTPEIGSRDGINCFGGISGFHAELRREFKWGNFNLVVFGFLGGGPRGTVRRGGTMVFIWGNVLGYFPECGWGNMRVSLRIVQGRGVY
jgi:hypothetical protein